MVAAVAWHANVINDGLLDGELEVYDMSSFLVTVSIGLEAGKRGDDNAQPASHTHLYDIIIRQEESMP